ncbi:MAG: hypothetical protein RLZZ333_1332, partial [Bacteroidota bacterium]
FKIIDALYPMLNFLFPSFVSTLQELALAMIHLIIIPYESSTIEVKDIKFLAIQNQLIAK